MALEPELIPGARGAFDVVVNGRTIFSKHTEYRFPEHREIVAALKAMRD